MAGVWAFRARSEREASRRFDRLSRQLASQGAAPVVTAMARKAADDERRHAVRCAEVAGRYGHAAIAEETLAAGEIGPASLGARERLLYEVVAFCCVTESINAALMTVSLELAEAPAVRAAVREILRDEVSHARLGWAHLAAERARGGGASIGAALPAMLSGTVRDELFSPADDDPQGAELSGHGELPRSTRAEILVATLGAVVFPGLEAHGIDTSAGRLWLAGRRPDGAVASPGLRRREHPLSALEEPR